MTLRLRIIALIALFAGVVIAGFAAIQVFNRLQSLNEHNTYRIRVGAAAAKTALEYTLAVQQAQRPTEDPRPALQQELARLRAGALVDEALLLTPAGRPAAPQAPRPGGLVDDGRWAPYAVTAYTAEQWFYPAVTPIAVYAYVPLLQQQKPVYVARFTFGLANVAQAMRDVYGPSVGMAAGVLLVSTLLAWLLTRAILGPIETLNEATRDIAAGNLALKVPVSTAGELGELAGTFNEMTAALVAMKARAENANPLTKLPGNNVIREEIERRLASGQPFVAVYADLDNFKAFNDAYGIGAGDQVITLTAKILKEALHQGAPGDFLGHEGGDDFVLLTTPEQAPAVTEYLCRAFDQRVRGLYKPEDQAHGGIVSTDRAGNIKEFPIMTISLAGCSNLHRPIRSYAEVTNICAEVKKKVKALSAEGRKSTYLLDRRRGESRLGPAARAAPPTTPPPA